MEDERLAGRPTHEALGLDEAILALDEDAVNAAIFERHRDLSLAEVLGTVRASHGAARARLATLGDRTVAGAVADVLPPGAEGGGDPAAPWIGGNTWEHYAAHHDWIRALVDRR